MKRKTLITQKQIVPQPAEADRHLSQNQALPPRIKTYDKDVNEILEFSTPKEAARLARRFEDWAVAIRSGLGSAGFGPQRVTSCMVHANYYVHFGLSKSQLARLKEAAAMFLTPAYASSSNAAYYLLNTALANLEFMGNLLRNDAKQSRRPLVGMEFVWETKSRAALDRGTN